MLDIKPNMQQIRKLERSIDGTKRKLHRELKIAVRATAKKGKSIVNANVRQELAVKKADVDRHISIKMRLEGKAPSATIVLKKSARLPVKAFNPRHTKKGVSFKISKKKKRSTVQGAFMGPRPGTTAVKLHGHAFKRVGRERLPIVKLHGASPWGAFKKQRMKRPATTEIRRYFAAQVDRRVRAALVSKGKFK